MKRLALLLLAVATTAAQAIDPPSWAVGTFKGFNSNLNKDVRIVVYGHGDVEYTVSGSPMLRGFWGSGGFSITGVAYYVESERDGIRVTQSTNAKNRGSYAKSGGFPGWYPAGWDNGMEGGWQDRPSWAIGNFSGRSRKWGCSFDLTVRQDGSATASVRFDDGRLATQKGRVDSNSMTLASARFTIRKAGNGFDATEAGDGSNVISFRKDSGWGQPDNSWNWNQATPNWAVGNFSGRSRSWACNFDLRVGSDGNARATVRFDDGRKLLQTGKVSGNRMRLDEAEFTIRRSGNGFEATEIKNLGNVITFNGGSDNSWGQSENSWNQAAPSWAVGNFNGRSRTWACNFDLRVGSDGNARATVRFDDGRKLLQTGKVSGNRMRLDEAEFTLRRVNGGFEATETKNAANVVSFSGGGGGWNPEPEYNWNQAAPSWAVGNFNGRSRTWECNFDLRVGSDGNVRATVRFDDGRKVLQTGKVSGNRMRLDKAEFTIRRVGGGFEATEIKDSRNVIRFD